MHPKKDSHSASLIDNQSTEPYNINNRKRLGRGFQGLIGDVPQMHVGVLNRMSGRALEWHSRGKGFDPPHLHQKKNRTLLRPVFSFGLG